MDRVLMRLRDKSTEIRGIVLRKLVGEKYPLDSTNPFQRYRLLYDGYGNKESSVQQDTIKLFLKYFEEIDPKAVFYNFVNLFEPHILLAHPHLYTLFDLLVMDLIEEMPINFLSDFIRKFTSELRAIGKGGVVSGFLYELIWLKNIGRSENSDLRALFDESVPSGMELARILSELVKREDIFSIYECLQLFSLQRSADEIGRNKMFESLKRMVS